MDKSHLNLSTLLINFLYELDLRWAAWPLASGNRCSTRLDGIRDAAHRRSNPYNRKRRAHIRTRLFLPYLLINFCNCFRNRILYCRIVSLIHHLSKLINHLCFRTSHRIASSTSSHRIHRIFIPRVIVHI